MAHHVRIRRLFESHLTVSDLQRSVSFYRDLVGLRLALEVPERNAAFFWVGEAGDSLLGLWSIGTAPLGLTLHVAFEVTMDDLWMHRRSWKRWALPRSRFLARRRQSRA